MSRSSAGISALTSHMSKYLTTHRGGDGLLPAAWKVLEIISALRNNHQQLSAEKSNGKKRRKLPKKEIYITKISLLLIFSLFRSLSLDGENSSSQPKKKSSAAIDQKALNECIRQIIAATSSGANSNNVTVDENSLNAAMIRSAAEKLLLVPTS